MLPVPLLRAGMKGNIQGCSRRILAQVNKNKGNKGSTTMELINTGGDLVNPISELRLLGHFGFYRPTAFQFMT